MSLWLPESCQFTITGVQSPEVRSVNGWPVVLLGMSGFTDWNEVQGGLTCERGRSRLDVVVSAGFIGSCSIFR